MVTYVKPDGTRFALSFHEPGEWAAKVGDQLRALGCSLEYTARAAQSYAGAVPVKAA